MKEGFLDIYVIMKVQGKNWKKTQPPNCRGIKDSNKDLQIMIKVST